MISHDSLAASPDTCWSCISGQKARTVQSWRCVGANLEIEDKICVIRMRNMPTLVSMKVSSEITLLERTQLRKINLMKIKCIFEPNTKFPLPAVAVDSNHYSLGTTSPFCDLSICSPRTPPVILYCKISSQMCGTKDSFVTFSSTLSSFTQYNVNVSQQIFGLSQIDQWLFPLKHGRIRTHHTFSDGDLICTFLFNKSHIWQRVGLTFTWQPPSYLSIHSWIKWVGSIPYHCHLLLNPLNSNKQQSCLACLLPTSVQDVKSIPCCPTERFALQLRSSFQAYLFMHILWRRSCSLGNPMGLVLWPWWTTPVRFTHSTKGGLLALPHSTGEENLLGCKKEKSSGRDEALVQSSGLSNRQARHDCCLFELRGLRRRWQW